MMIVIIMMKIIKILKVLDEDNYFENAIMLTFFLEGISISTTSFVMKAVSAALRSVPQVNIQNSDGNIITLHSTDITTTLHTPNGTHTGSVQNVDQMNLKDIEIALEVRNFHAAVFCHVPHQEEYHLLNSVFS